MSDLMYELTKTIVDTKYENLPSEAVEVAKRGILDTLGVTVAGSKAEGCEAVVNLVKEWGGKPESTIIVHGGKVPANLAGLAFGPMARARDFGDFAEPLSPHMARGPTHTDEYIIPTAFPLTERMGGVSGKDFLTALVLGEELLIRLSAAPKLGHTMTITGRHLCRIFGPTATCAKLLNFDEEKMMNAFGLAYSQKIGDMQAYLDGVLSVRVRHGLIADAAIKSVLLAERGITGAKNLLQGQYGYFRSIEPESDLTVFDGFGKEFQNIFTGFKAYPCCNCTHSAIDATRALVKQHDIGLEDVEEVQVGTNKFNYDIAASPEEVKNNPQTIVECQFSIPYCVSTAIARGDVFIDDFTLQTIRRPEVRALIPKVKTGVDPGIADWPGNGPAIVTIKTKDGKEYTKRVDYKTGHPNNPMSMDEIADKFRRCMPFSAKPIPDENIEKVMNMVRSLEKLKDVTPLVELLTQ